jgi:hypothetical protein
MRPRRPLSALHGAPSDFCTLHATVTILETRLFESADFCPLSLSRSPQLLKTPPDGTCSGNQENQKKSLRLKKSPYDMHM